MVGYHGASGDGTPFSGCIRYDNSDRTEAFFPANSTHFPCNDLGLVVGDGSRNDSKLMLWRFQNGAFEGPRTVLNH